jgi:hypothetical protein
MPFGNGILAQLFFLSLARSVRTIAARELRPAGLMDDLAAPDAAQTPNKRTIADSERLVARRPARSQRAGHRGPRASACRDGWTMSNDSKNHPPRATKTVPPRLFS